MFEPGSLVLVKEAITVDWFDSARTSRSKLGLEIDAAMEFTKGQILKVVPSDMRARDMSIPIASLAYLQIAGDEYVLLDLGRPIHRFGYQYMPAKKEWLEPMFET